MPRHSKIYTDLIPIMEDVVTRYMADVKDRSYPAPEHTAYMSDEGLETFARDMKWETKLEELERKRSGT